MIILRINIDCKLFLWENRDSFAFLSENFLLVSKQKKEALTASSFPIYIEENLLLRRFLIHTASGVSIGTMPHMAHIRIDDHSFFDCRCDKGFR